MKRRIKDIIYKYILVQSALPTDHPEEITPFRFAKAFRAFRLNIIHHLKDVVLIFLGVMSAAFGLESFLIPNSFIDGGATGIALLSAEVSGMSLSLLLPLINIPFIFMAYRIGGPVFAGKTIMAILLLAIVVGTVHFPEVTHEKLLVAVFGGFFLGAGIGLAVRAGSVIDGTEILAIYLSRKLSASIGDVILIFKVILFSIAAYFLSVETALYSMVTYFAASKTLDFISEGIDEYVGVTIVASKSEEIQTMITEHLGRGVTVYNGKKGFGKTGSKSEVEIIYTVITRLELNKLNTEIEKIEPTAFVVMNNVKDTRGGMIKKRPLKHG
jgi:uncharacterized membrane-anchored protein YitT (DUF2179 family)